MPCLGFLVFVFGALELCLCALKLLFKGRCLLASLVVAGACPLKDLARLGVFRALVTQALLGCLGCLFGLGEFFVPLSAPVGAFGLRLCA